MFDSYATLDQDGQCACSKIEDFNVNARNRALYQVRKLQINMNIHLEIEIWI